MAGEDLEALLHRGWICGWSGHPHVPRERIVATAVNVRWIGFERVGARPGGAYAGVALLLPTDRLAFGRREVARRLRGRTESLGLVAVLMLGALRAPARLAVARFEQRSQEIGGDGQDDRRRLVGGNRRRLGDASGAAAALYPHVLDAEPPQPRRPRAAGRASRRTRSRARRLRPRCAISV
jgi:hypothetical protein